MAEEVRVKIFDEEHRIVKEVRVKDIEVQVDRIKEILEKCLAKLKDVEDYELDSFEVGLSLRAGLFVISAEGSITLAFEKKKD